MKAAAAVSDVAVSKTAAPLKSKPATASVVQPVNANWQLLALGAQAKLAVGAPDDPAEHEANGLSRSLPIGSTAPVVARKCSSCEAEEKPQHDGSIIARKVDDSASPHAHSALGISELGLSQGGSPLASSTRQKFETSFGADFSHVRIHDDASAHQSARNMNALAFTYGGNIAFAAGQFQPDTESGQHLLAHELTHVVQQTGARAPKVQRAASEGQSAYGPAAGNATGPSAILSDAAQRFASFQTNARGKLSSVQGNMSGKLAYLQGIAGEQMDRLGPLIARVQEIANGTDVELQQKLVNQLSSGTLARAEGWLNEVGGSGGTNKSPPAGVYPASNPNGSTAAPAINQHTAPTLARKSIDVSSSSDPAEIEAERVADAVIYGGRPPQSIRSTPTAVHRFAEEALELITSPEAVELVLIAMELMELEAMISASLIVAAAAFESALLAVEAAVALVIVEILLLPEEILIALIIAAILLILLIIVLLLVLIYYLFFAEPDNPDDPDEEECEPCGDENPLPTQVVFTPAAGPRGGEVFAAPLTRLEGNTHGSPPDIPSLWPTLWDCIVSQHGPYRWVHAHLLHGETSGAGARNLHGPGNMKENIILSDKTLNGGMSRQVEQPALTLVHDQKCTLWYRVRVNHMSGAGAVPYFAESVFMDYGYYNRCTGALGPSLIGGGITIPNNPDRVPPTCPDPATTP